MSFSLVAALNRSLHSPIELILLDNIDPAADLLADFVGRLKPPHFAFPAGEAFSSVVFESANRFSERLEIAS